MNERDRIELLMKSYALSPSQFADKTGIQRASVSHILSGRNKPSLEVMLKIYEAFPGLSMEWLMAGIGKGPSRSDDALESSELQQVGLFGNIETGVGENDSNSLFVNTVVDAPVMPVVRKPRANYEFQRQADAPVQQPEKRRTTQSRATVQAPVVQRKIKEVRIFYTDGTYETLVPEK